MVRGEIVQNSPSDLAWKLGDLDTWKPRIPALAFLNECLTFNSSNFVYNGHNWHLQLIMRNDTFVTFRQLRLNCRRSADGSESFTQAYSLGISDDKGVVRWTSPALTDKFGSDSCGTSQNIAFLKSEIRECTIHLRFETTKERQPAAAVDLEETNSHSRFSTDAGTQTCSDGTIQLSKNFKDLFLKGHKTDVTLKVEGTKFKAHKVILSARSPVFEKMFDHGMLEETSGSVTITDCEPEDFHTFLLFLYTGKVEKPTVKSSVGLYCLADKYNVEGLAPYCVQFLLSNISVESYCDIVSLGLRHCDTELMTHAKAFFARNLEQIIRTEQWKCFNSENPAEANDILIQGISQVNLVPK